MPVASAGQAHNLECPHRPSGASPSDVQRRQEKLKQVFPAAIEAL